MADCDGEGRSPYHIEIIVQKIRGRRAVGQRGSVPPFFACKKL